MTIRVAAKTAGVVMLGAALVAGCSRGKEKQAQADAKAAAFVPPAVTSRVDYGSQADRRFRTLDRNGDDRISTNEWPRANSRLRELDRNGDGAVTAIEWSDGQLRRFDQMDLNKDGTVTSEEQGEWRAARRAGRALPAPAASPAIDPTAPTPGNATGR